MAQVGDTILAAAQNITAQLQNQSRLKAQQEQFKAQLAQAERTFSLREQEARARERKLQLEEEEQKLRLQSFPATTRLKEAQATQLEQLTDPKLKELKLREQELRVQKLEMELKGELNTGNEKDFTQRGLQLTRDRFVQQATLLRERQTTQQYIDSLDPSQSAPLQEFRARSLKELEEARTTLEKAILDPFAQPTERAALQAKKAALDGLIANSRAITQERLSGDQLVDLVAATEGVPKDDLGGIFRIQRILGLQQIGPARERQLFGPAIASDVTGLAVLDDAWRRRDVDWFAEMFAPFTRTPDGNANKPWLDELQAWVEGRQENEQDGKQFLQGFLERVQQ